MESSQTAVMPEFPPRGRRRKKPGPKPGQPHSGQFKPGINPDGSHVDERRHRGGQNPERARIRRTIEELAADHVEDALAAIAELIRGDDTPAKVRLEASSEVLDRAFGSVVNRVLHAQTNGAGHDLENSSPDQLVEWMRTIKAQKEAQNDLETTYEEVHEDEKPRESSA